MTDDTQEHRPVAIHTPLGKDVLLFRRMTVSEQLSRPFDYTVEVVSANHNIAFERILGQNVTVRLNLSAGGVRYFNAFVSQFSYQGMDGRLARYVAQLSPWLWFLTQTANCRIFSGDTVPEICKKVCKAHGFTDIESKLSKKQYRKWEHCVQYRETDFNFVSRLLEQEGIFYYFRHDEHKHVLVLGDDDASVDKVAGYESVPFLLQADGSVTEREYLSDLMVTQTVQPGKCVLRDYDYEKPGQRPGAELEVRVARPFRHAYGESEVYDYPGEYQAKDEGNDSVRVRLEELQADQEQVEASGTVRGLAPGCRFSLTGYPRQDQNREYLVTGVTLEIAGGAYESGLWGEGDFLCNATITAMDFGRPFRPMRTTPKPLMEGVQTAVVVGSSKEDEIHTDKYGRIRVQFHWDREHDYNEKSSCWVRVGQPWASKGFGFLHTPRVGDEVVVVFLEGDPDRPLVIGSAYNDLNQLPLEFPANKTQCGIKTRSSPKGNAQNFNQIRFEDKKDHEELYVHAERALTTLVEATETRTVGKDRSTTIGNDETVEVKGLRQTTVHKDENINVKQHRTVHVDNGHETIVIHTGNQSVSVNSGHATLNVRSKNRDVNVPAGAYQLQAKDIRLTASNSIEIVCGGGSIKLEANGAITINGVNLKSIASALNDIKGNLVKINT